MAAFSTTVSAAEKCWATGSAGDLDIVILQRKCHIERGVRQSITKYFSSIPYLKSRMSRLQQLPATGSSCTALLNALPKKGASFRKIVALLSTCPQDDIEC
jgi:hypothetical protein